MTHSRIIYEKINSFCLLGGGHLLYLFAKHLKDNRYNVSVFTSPRYLEEEFDGVRFEKLIADSSIPCHTPEDINLDSAFIAAGKSGAIAIGFGENWTFSQESIDIYQTRLLDFMGIRLPQYRGGAHYTWQILSNNKISASNLQLINTDMVQGKFDSGQIVKSKEFVFSPRARLPQDYFDEAQIHHLGFLKEFVQEIENSQTFDLFPVAEPYSIFFDRLHTSTNALIDWSWDTLEIERFICAFDAPYPGASTFLNTERVFLKNCQALLNDGPFHPYQSGIIYRANKTGIYVASKSGTLLISSVFNENDKNITATIQPGSRFFTPRDELEKAILFRPDYDANGLKRI